MKVPSKKLEIVRKMNNKEKRMLQQAYYQDKNFRDMVRGSKELNWISNLVFAVSQKGSSSRQPIETLPKISQATSMLENRFFNNDYIMTYNNMTGNPSDYKRYEVLVNFAQSQSDGQGGNLVTFKIERFDPVSYTHLTLPTK
jgi:hypothetical protein